MSGSGWAPRLARAWVRCYTRRLPVEVAGERFAEITADLWDHEHDAVGGGRAGVVFQLEVIGRVLSGVPADLSWRRGILRSQPRPEPGGPTIMQRLTAIAGHTLVVLAALGIAPVLAVVPLLASQATDLTGAEVAWLATAAALAGLLVVGLVVRGRRPVVSTGLLVVGAAAPSIAWFWLPPAFLLSVAIAFTAVATTPRTAAAAP